MRSRLLLLALVIGSCALTASSAFSSAPVFGPKDYQRGRGTPTTMMDTFSAAQPGRTCTLRIDNGGSHGQFSRVSSAVVALDNVAVVGPSDFNQQVVLIQKPVTLARQNLLEVELRSQPGSGFTLQILCAGNSAPVANAGPDQTVPVGATVTLDGSRSTDPDGNALTYRWRLTTRPTGSAATLSDPVAIRPTFNVDRPGTYIAELVVNDGTLDSAPDTVQVSTVNSRPVANAGGDQTVPVGTVVTLDGSRSSDVDGDTLGFRWAFTVRPAGSTANLSNPTAMRPTFTVDRAGTYVVQLIVNDGALDSAPDTVQVSTENSPPVANAGPPQTVFVGSVVTLDGTKSSDVDGDALTFRWAFTARPAGSTATLSDSAAVRPTFGVDRPGLYTVQLIVNDGAADSAPATVNISTQNSRPVAAAGPDQTVAVGGTVTLDGSGSTDADGDPLTYRWSLAQRPAGSQAALSAPTAVITTFLVDVPGRYVAQLLVNDGALDSAPDLVQIDTLNSRPVANAGADLAGAVGAPVQLDGSGSSDADHDPLTFFWSFTTRPNGSAATFVDPTAVKPTFVADAAGTYVAQLIVNDGTLDSTPDTVVVLVTSSNRPPVANAGHDQVAARTATVHLDGTASSDPDGDPLTFAWTLTSRPAGSSATLADSTTATPTFVADVNGAYVARLVVNDSHVDSAPATTTITVVDGADLSIAFFAAPATPAVGFNATYCVQVRATGPAPSTGVIARMPLPAGITVSTQFSPSANPGTYDPVTGVWTIGDLGAPGQPNQGTLCVAGIIQPTGPYDVTASVAGNEPDPDPTNNTATAHVTPNGSADVSVNFFAGPATPPVGFGATYCIQVRASGPGQSTGVTAHMPIPAGYTITDSFANPGTYDRTTGLWTIGDIGAFGQSNQGTLCVATIVRATGPYDITATASGNEPDPDPTNNTATAHVTPNGNADLSVGFFSAPTAPPVGSTASYCIQMRANGPGQSTGITARMPIPAGYTITQIGVNPGTYDSTTGVWTIGALGASGQGNSGSLCVVTTVRATGPYDITTTISGNEPDPDLTNNTASVHVTPNPNADLSIAFINQPSGTVTVGSTQLLRLRVLNAGPAVTDGVTAHFTPPAGYTPTSGGPSIGTYDAATGTWVLGTMTPGVLQDLVLAATVNATGSLALTAAITATSAPDPNLADNAAAAAPANRPPIANAGVDQNVVTNTTATLDGTGSSDPDGDPLTFAWVLTARPANSAAVLASAAAATPSFFVDQPGRYAFQLTVTDSHGASNGPASVNVFAGVGDRAPVIGSKPITSAIVGQPYRYVVTATDPDAGQTLAFSLTTAPTGMAIDPATGAITWTPAANQAGQQAVAVRVQDPGSLSATQTFTIQVSSASNRAPIAVDDAYQVRIGESLSVPAPGVLANDRDPDGTGLSGILLTQPTNGTVAFNADGSFTYTPYTLAVGAIVPLENMNLASRMPGVTYNGRQRSTLERAFDDDPNTSARSDFTGTLFGDHPFFEVIFPSAVSVTRVDVIGTRDPSVTPIIVGTVELFDATGAVLFDSGPTDLPAPNHDAAILVPNLSGVRRARFTHIQDTAAFCCSTGLGELRVIGSALVQRPPGVPADANLAQLLPVTVNASGFIGNNIPESVVDGGTGFPNWYADGTSPAFIELVFPLDITVTKVETANPSSRPDGFGSSNPILCNGTYELFDADDNVLFSSGLVNQPCCFLNPTIVFDLPVPNVTRVRRVRYTNAGCPGSSFPPGFSEFRVFGPPPVALPPFTMTRKFQALVGRQAHSTPVVANLKLEDNVPSIIVPVESVGNQLTGDLKVVSGKDGRELATLGFGIVSPWAEVAVGDLDGDGFPDIVALHADGSHLVAFDLAGGVMDGELTQLLKPVTVNTSSAHPQFPAVNAVDGDPASEWFTAVTDAVHLGTQPFFETTFRQDVTVTRVELAQRLPGNTNRFNAGTIQLFAADGTLLSDSGVVTLSGANTTIVGSSAVTAIPFAGIGGVRRVRFNSTDDSGNPGLGEFRVFGSAAVPVGVARVKWMSDAASLPVSPPLVSAAVTLANLDGGPHPHIIVGALVFDSNGKLLGDGRTLGGTTGGTGLRSAMPAVADLFLDGHPAIVAGPTAYRLDGGQLTKLWQRADRPDGYVGIANFDDDPFPEIVVAASGLIYMLNHDGSDAEVWNPPSHAPIVVPGGLGGAAPDQSGPPLIVDVDGDGIPEIGIATSSNFILYNRDGSIRWKAGISDHSSHSTGSVSFDFMGDGEVSIVYRDEGFLRVFRGRDGVLLAKVPLTSSTWAEEPVIVDVDNDGHADIVVVSNNFGDSSPTNTGVHVFQDTANKWQRTRRIWNQSSYHVTNVNEDGSIPVRETPHWLVSGLNAFRTNAFVPGETPDAADRFTYVATDGVLQSNEATVRIAIRTPNSAPTIISSPATTAATGVAYLYGVRASDPDAGDVLTFSLPTAPTGMTIDPNTGLVRWTPTATQLGSQSVTVKVHDIHGAFALQAYTIQVGTPVSVPDVVGQTQPDASAMLTSATLVVGTTTLKPSATTPAGSVLSQSPSPGASVAPGSAVNLVVASGPPPPGVVPNVVGQVQSNAQADVLAAGFVVGAVTSRADDFAAAGVVVAQAPAAGTMAAGGSAVDLVLSIGPAHVPDIRGLTVADAQIALSAAGFVVGTLIDQNSDTVPLNAVIGSDPAVGSTARLGSAVNLFVSLGAAVPGDTTPPTVSIDAPADLAVITMPTDIVATANDEHFVRYRLEIGGVDDTTLALLGSGEAPVVGAVLGRIEPTLLENGLYRVRLTAEDANGAVSVAERVYQVQGFAKIGLLALTFTDLDVPVAGIPITVTRTYDNRVKAQRDFGVAWSLGVATGTYRNNRPPGQGWVIQDLSLLGGRVPCIGGALETRSHLTEVRLSDREAYTFVLVVTNGNLGVTGACEGTASFQFVAGTTPGATLDILDGTGVLYLRGGDDTLLDEAAFLDGVSRVYEPHRVRLTTTDGRITELDATAGVTRIADPNGNQLTVTPDGIIHSSGKSIAFVRDALGRISDITDASGHHLAYAYDDAGDLVAFTDQAGQRTTFTYDTEHNLVQLRDPLGRIPLRSDFDADGRLIAVTDANGNRTTIAHDIDAREEIVTDRLGNVTVVGYDERGNVVRRVDPLGRTTLMTYDARDNLLSTTDAVGRVAVKTYDASNNVLSKTDFDGNTTTFTYNAQNQLASVTTATGGTTTYLYDRHSNLVESIDPLGNTLDVTYDDNGNGLTRQDALGQLTSYIYDADGNLLSLQDPRGTSFGFSYDTSGNKVSETFVRTRADSTVEQITKQMAYDPLGHLTALRDAAGSIALTMDPSGRVERIVDGEGLVRTYEYDPLGNLVRITYPDGSTDTFSYDAAARMTAKTDRDGRRSAFEYDALGRRVRTTLPDGAVTEQSYDGVDRVTAERDGRGNTTLHAYGVNQETVTDALGHITVHTFDGEHRRARTVDANGNATAWTYDAAGRLTATTFADGASRRVLYDANGRRIAETDEAGQTVTFAYDSLDHLVAVTDPLGNTTSYAYDEAGNRVSETDALGRVTRLEYDGAGRLIGRVLPLGQRETFALDANGNVTSHTDFNGATTRFTYDGSNRLVRKDFPDGSTTAYAFSPAGLRTQAGGDTAVFDGAGRIVRQITSEGDVLDYIYDAAGNRTAVTTPAGTITYGYDALNRLASVTDVTGTTTYTYDAVGNLASTTYPSAVVTAYTYDVRNRLIAVTTTGPQGSIASYSYMLDAVGRRLRVVETSDAGTRTVDYAYDAAGRLAQETIEDPAVGWVQTSVYLYDAVGNRVRTTVTGGGTTTVTTASYDANNRLLSEATTSGADAAITTYAYDRNGNLLGRARGSQNDTYAYDAENRLVSADVHIDAAPGSVGFTYDADGVRRSKTVAGVTTRFLSAPFGGLPQVVAEINATSLTAYTFGNQLISQTRPGLGTRFYLYDGQLSTRQLTDAAGLVTDGYTYDAYGNLLSASGSSSNDFLYRAQQFDATIGAYYLRARYYSPSTGRFLTTDPLTGDIFDPPSLHRYLYASADPVNRWDPSGKDGLIDTMQAVAIQGVLLTIRIALPVLNGVARAEGRLLGSELLIRIATRFGPELGEETVRKILVEAGLKNTAAKRLAAEATGQTVEKIAEAGRLYLVRAEQTSGQNTTTKILGVIFALFLGDRARADEDARGLAPQNSDERLAVAGIKVFLDEDRPYVNPRFRAVYDALSKVFGALP